MITVELPTALAIYSILLGALAAGIWLYTEISVRKPQRQLGQQFLWKCTFCGCTYLDEQAEALSQCPRCENFNAAGEAAVYQVGDTTTRAEISASQDARNTSRRKRHHQTRRGPRRRR
jgi:hypothetical protein